MKNSFAIGALLCISAGAILRAQTPGACDLRGEVQQVNANPQDTLTVDLVDLQGMRSFDQSRVNFDGTFAIHNVPCGEYMLKVLDSSGKSLREEYVTLRPDGFPLTIRLPKRQINRPAEGAVSVERLREPIPKKAFHAFVAAEKFTGKQQYDRAIAELKKAIQIYPRYTEAHCNLGVQYIRKGQPQQALAELNTAIEIGPPHALQYGNLAFALWMLRRFPEAETAARRSVALDGTYLQGHYVLGAVLAQQGSKPAEAVQHLRLAADEFPTARLSLAQVYAVRGQPEAALHELKEYEPAAPAKTREMVDKWISQLEAYHRTN